MTGEPASRVTPLARATGAEVGLRPCASRACNDRHGVDARARLELVFGATPEQTMLAGRAAAGHRGDDVLRHATWFVFDGDLAISSAVHGRRSGRRPHPGAVAMVVSAGARWTTCANVRQLRWRYFGPRALVEDDTVRSKATSLVNLTPAQAHFSVRLALDVFNSSTERTATSTTSTGRASPASRRRHRRLPSPSAAPRSVRRILSRVLSISVGSLLSSVVVAVLSPVVSSAVIVGSHSRQSSRSLVGSHSRQS